MGLLNLKKGIKYPEDFENVHSFRDAAKLVKKLDYRQSLYYLHARQNGLPSDTDIRLKWLATAIHEYQRADLKSKYYLTGSHIQSRVFHTYHLDKNGDRMEVYQNESGKYICGAPLKTGNGWVCSQKAGFGTNHLGYGRCYFHERELSSMEKSLFWQKMGALSKARSLSDIAEQAEQLEQVERSLETDLSYLNIAKRLQLKRIDTYMQTQSDNGSVNPVATEKDIRLLKELAISGSNIKKNIHFIEARGMIPVDQIGAILVRVLEAVTEGEDDQIRARIAQRAMSLKDDLVLPIFENDSNKLPSVTTGLGEKMLGKVRDNIKKDNDWDELVPPKSRVINNKHLEYTNEDL